MPFITIVDTDGRDVTVNTDQITHVVPLVNGCKLHLADGHTILAQVAATEFAKQLASSSPR